MRWARTLMLSEMLTKAIHANVAAEAQRPTKPQTKPTQKESAVTDPAAPATDQTTTEAPAPTQSPDAPASAPTDATPETASEPSAASADCATETAATANASDDVLDKLQLAAQLTQTLQGNPDVLRFLNALFGYKG